MKRERSATPKATGADVAPEWHQLDPRSNTQAYWDGEQWTKTRRWRGTGWVEESDDPNAPAGEEFTVVNGSVTSGAAPRAQYLSPSTIQASASKSRSGRARRRNRPND
jgi:hypothetical protein